MWLHLSKFMYILSLVVKAKVVNWDAEVSNLKRSDIKKRSLHNSSFIQMMKRNCLEHVELLVKIKLQN